MIIQQNSIKNLRRNFYQKLLFTDLIGDKGPSAEECRLSNGPRIADLNWHVFEMNCLCKTTETCTGYYAQARVLTIRFLKQKRPALSRRHPAQT